MLIKDMENGTVRKYGTNSHDSLEISQDGRTLTYYNLQCGEGSKYGCYRFVMEDGEVPSESYTPDAVNGFAYFNIGGWEATYIQVRAAREELINDCVKIVHDYFNQVLDDNPNWSMSNMDKYAFIPNKTICTELEKLKEGYK